MYFKSRVDAGQQLAAKLVPKYRYENCEVIALSADARELFGAFLAMPGRGVFAHGFLVLSDSADFLYKTTDYYAPQHERCIAWNDPQLGIDWPDVGAAPSLSAKDEQGLPFARAEYFL